MTGADLPMYDLFTRLRLAGLPLGVDDYEHFVRALAAGFGLPDHEALRRLCRLLWTKSPEEARVLDFHFDRLVAEERRAKIDVPPGPGAPGSGAAPNEASASTGVGKGSPTEEEKVPDITLASALGGDEVQSVRTVLQLAERGSEAALSRFVLSTEYFPVTQRQMKQSFRHLRYLVREGPPVELDVRATVDRLTTQEVLVDAVLMPRRINRAEMLLLIDRDGSMVPFHGLARRLEEAAIRGGRLRRVETYYFHDCPMDHLYGDASMHDATVLDDILHQLTPEYTGVLVVSDAGAARGDFDPERVHASQRFLQRMRGKIRRMAWLNPMPSSRWEGTSAAVVARLVPMFEISRRGLDRAIGVLKGRPAHTGEAGA
jgi:uncharacterized protein